MELGGGGGVFGVRGLNEDDDIGVSILGE